MPSVEFDIALVRLDGDVVTSDEISYACLPSTEEVLLAGEMRLVMCCKCVYSPNLIL